MPMKLTYDKEADAILLRFRDGRVSRDQQLSENVFAGYTREGELVEIQILDVKSIEPAWLSLEATAKIVGKSTRTLLRWIEAGRVRPPKVGRDYRFSAEMVQAIAETSERETDAHSAAPISTGDSRTTTRSRKRPRS